MVLRRELAGLAVLTAWAAAPASSQTLADTIGGCGIATPERTIAATPQDYRSLLTTLGPGDRLLLAAGTYTQGLPLDNLNGEPNRCIVIEGPEAGARAVFTGRACCNTVSLTDSSYIAFRHLDLDGQGLEVDAVKAESPSVSVHHVTLDDLVIRGHGANQQIVGVSTKCPAWNWVIRRTTILGAGTGIYLGNSDGSAEFSNGLVEHNLVRDTIGYNMQVKFQNGRATGAGAPASAATVIRHNVFSKANGASSGDDARPNLLVGAFPDSGPGSNDRYEIYGNFFFQNPTEALFQGTGNVALYDNVFLNDFGPAVNFQAHEGRLNRTVDAFHNTVVSSGRGISVTGVDSAFTQRVTANAVFADLPIQGGLQTGNVEDLHAAAGTYLVNPTGPVGAGLDLFPRAGRLTGTAVTTPTSFRDAGLDFNSTPRSGTFRGAYAGEGQNPGWPLALEIKPAPAAAPSVSLSIDDRTVAEGAAVNAAFRVVLSAPSAQTVTVAYATADQTAVAPGDYASTSGVLTFTPGRTIHSLIVPIVTDAIPEADETFVVNLATPTNAGIIDGQAVGTITNPPPAMHVAMYRAYSRQTDYHFFTTELASKNFAVSVLGFQDESSPVPFYVWNVQQTDAVPLFRMYNPNLGRHYYTADVTSRDSLMGIGMAYEKDEGFIHPLGTTPPSGTAELFRLYNNNSGTHLFTADAAQKDGILALFPGVWVQHTSVGYVFTGP